MLLNRNTRPIVGVCLLLLCALVTSATGSFVPSNLLVDWKPTGFAQGIESRFPTFSWAVIPNEAGTTAYIQSSYQVLVSSSLKLLNSDEGDVWDSGSVASSESSNVIFQNGQEDSRSITLHKAVFYNNEDLQLTCEGNAHIASLQEFSWDSSETSKSATLEALKRRCKHHKSCSLPASYDAATLVWTCAANPLSSRTTYYWKVRAWFQANNLSLSYSEPSAFTTSTYGEWTDAIAIYGKSPSGFTYLRTEQNITIDSGCSLQAATAYATAAGSNKLFSAYKLYINNVWIGSGPGHNNYLNQQLYDSYDVFALFQNVTSNDIPIVVAAECFHLTAGALQFSLDFQYLCKNSSVTVTPVISSSQKWKSLFANDIYNPTGSSGPTYTQPHEYISGVNWIDSWKELNFDDSSWDPASLAPKFTTPLIAKSTLPVAVSLAPIVFLKQVAVGHYFFYLEREVMGGIVLTANNTQSKPVQIEIRLGEELNGADSVMYKMRTGNVYQDFWTLKPGFNNLHHHEYMEWRYGEILNFPGNLQVNDINVWVYNYPFDDSLSSFSSSVPALDAIYELCKYTVKATSLDLLTDSNTRERQPYEADMYITTLSLLSVMPSFPILRATLAWLLEFPTWPTEWHLLTNSAAELDYMSTGNLWIAENFWTVLSTNSFVSQYFNASLGLLDKPVDASNGINDIVDWPAVMRDGYVMTNVDTVINAHVYRAANILASFAQLTNQTPAVSFFENAASQIYKNVNSKLINGSGIYVDGLNVAHTAAHASAFALDFGLVNSANFENVISFLLGKGMVGSPYFAHFLLDGLYSTNTSLAANGAFKLLTSTAENSWLAMINLNATMTTEMWNVTEKPNMSWSHPWSTTPLVMITRRIMGITPLSPAYSKVQIAPQPPSTIPFNASITIPTIKGPISVSLATIPNTNIPENGVIFEKFEMTIVIPANVVAETAIPMGSDKLQTIRSETAFKLQVMVNGEEIEEVWEGRMVRIAKKLGGGKHHISVKLRR